MFFFWYLENKHFKKRVSPKGQVVPFLLVVLVILLIASLSTINIGRVSLDKTAANNSADAGALASASAYAGAFNWLAETNEVVLWLTYQQFRVVMYDLYEEGDSIIDVAIAYGATAMALALAGYYTVQSGVPTCCAVFNWQYLVAMALYIASASACVLSAAEVQKFIVVSSFMRSLVDNHYETQKENYRVICESMQEARVNSSDTGYYYNFSNANISSKLSEEQSNQLSAWFSAEGYTSGSYTWQDKISQAHTVNASIDVPGISSYQLQKTEYSYTKEGNLIDKMISTGTTINTILNVQAMLLWMAAGWLAGMSFASAISFALCFNWYTVGLAMSICSGTIWPMWNAAVSLSIAIVGNLMALVAVGAGMTYWFLKSSIKEAYEGIFMDGIYSSSSCGDVDDILMVKISSVTLPTWETTSCAEQIHPGTSIGITNTSYPLTRSCARATFDSRGFRGGAIGDFLQIYDPVLTSTY